MQYRVSSSRWNDDKTTIFSTIKEAQAAVRACLIDFSCFGQADRIDVRIDRGRYELAETWRLTPEDSGPIPVRWIGGAGVVLSGGTAITNWERLPGGPLWTATVPSNVTHFNQLFVNSERRTRARTPNLGDYHKWKSPLCELHRGHIDTCSLWARYGFVYDGDDVKSQYRNEKNVEFVIYHGWTASRHHLRNVVTENSSVIFTNPAEYPIGHWPNHDSESGGRYYIDNTFEGLDSPGEWYYDESNRKVLYWPLSGEDVPGLDFVAARLTQIVDAFGVKNTHMTDMAIQYSDWSCGETEKCDHQSTEWQTTAAIRIRKAENVTLDGLHILNHGPYAVWIDDSSQNVVVRSCFVEDLGTGGIRIGNNDSSTDVDDAVQNILVFNNTIKNGGWVFPSGTGIFIQFAYNVNVSHNEVSYFSYTGISVGWSWNFNPTTNGGHYVGYNHVYNLGLRRELGDAMACFYTLGIDNGTRIVNNLCHDVYAFYTGGYCVSQDQGSSGLFIGDNVCFRFTGSPQNQHYGVNNTYENNMFLDGYASSWTDRNAGALRTSPQADLPNSFALRNNIVMISNESALLFDGNWNDTGSPRWSYELDRNVYWSTASDLSRASVFGGCTARMCGSRAFNYTLSEWQKSGRDVHSVVADPMFADPERYHSLNFELKANSPALRLGFRQIDLSQVGPLP